MQSCLLESNLGVEMFPTEAFYLVAVIAYEAIYTRMSRESPMFRFDVKATCNMEASNMIGVQGSITNLRDRESATAI
jgi:hypothetical protein